MLPCLGILILLLVSTAAAGQANTTYDFIIVGGGTAGLTVANRLSENPDVSVLVVEYGYLDNNYSVLIPYNANFVNFRDLYNISSTPLVHMNNKPYPISAAATVGGGSVVNGMFFDRASRLDYDAWEELGNPGWGWKGLLPYFIKSTNFTPPSLETAAKYNYTWKISAWGNDGPVHASLPPWQWPEMPTFRQAFQELDRGIRYPKEGSDGSGVGLFWVPNSQDPTMQTRSDARTAYYDPVAHRLNLHLVTGTKANKVFFEGKTAIGVQMTSREDTVITRAYASKEVILAAGPLFSSNVLQLSGVGAKEMLREAGIPLVQDLPGVGKNFQDHPTAYFIWNLTTDTYPNPQLLQENSAYKAMARDQYFQDRTGPYVEARGNAAAFLSLQTIASSNFASLLSSLTSQNATQYLPSSYDSTTTAGYAAQHAILLKHFASQDSAVYEYPFAGQKAVTISLQQPLSRGTIALNITCPTCDPVVDFNTLSNPLDGIISVAMLNFTRADFATPLMQSTFSPVEVIPGAKYASTEEILQVLTAGLLTPSFAHPSCSNAMMPLELGGVVSPTLQVYGLNNLSVVDVSIMPMIPASHLSATVYAIAEKAADLTKKRHSLA